MRAYGCWHGWSAWWGSMGHPPELDWPSTRAATNSSVIDSTSSPPTGGQAMMCSWRRLAICSTSFVVRLFCHQAPSEYLSSGWHFEKGLTNFARVTSCVGLSWWTHINISPVVASWLPDNINLCTFLSSLSPLLPFGIWSIIFQICQDGACFIGCMACPRTCCWRCFYIWCPFIFNFNFGYLFCRTPFPALVGRPFPYPYARTVVRNFIVTRTAHPLCDNLLLLL